MPSQALLPSLSVLRSFEAAARYQSYTRAAEELGVTQGAVSRQVRELESMLGVSLFRRVGRAVELTRAGQALSVQIRRDLEGLRTTIARTAAAGAGARILSLAVPPTFGARWLAPRLARFRAKYPNVELDIQSRTEAFDLAAARIDIAIHFGRADWPGARLRQLCPERLVAVISPALAGNLEISGPEDLFRAPLIHLTSRPGLWERYRDTLGTNDRGGALPGTRMDQFSMIIMAAASGAGAAIVPTYLVEPELATGALVAIGDVPSARAESYFLATPTGASDEVVNQFSDWIVREVRN